MKIPLPLPAAVTSRFVVAVERLPCPVPDLVPWRVGKPYRKAAMTAHGTPGLEVTHHRSPWRGVTMPPGSGVRRPRPSETPPPTAWSPASPHPDERRLPHHDGCRALHHDERRLLRRAGQHLVVSSAAPPHRLPGSAQVARATARALARQCGGLVIDPLTGTTVPSCERCPDEPVVFRPADDWLSWDVQVHDDATCPPWDPADTAACDCLRVTSRGLRRFALPEITIDGAACAHTLCATNLLRTVAHHLLADHLAFLARHPRADVRLIDDHVHISTPNDPTAPAERPGSADPAATPSHRRAQRAAGGSPATTSPSSTSSILAGPSFDVRLTPCETEPPAMGRPGSVRRLKVAPVSGTGQATCLKVGPPSGFTGSLNDWLCATRQASPPRYAAPPYPLAA
ncbi:hypothetical protein [Nonomuraea sp. NPDC050691]|uniref:hypothetical protein n=1 Tax=Nonomuraea sp. NPDC050691 TaxID=3155661 RepID=UPI0033CE2425